MHKDRFLTRLSSGAFVAVVATGGVLFINGVSDATPPVGVRQVMATSTSTTTTLSSSVSSVTQGEEVTLTATVTPSAAAGMVQFKNGVDNLGNSVTVKDGTAMATISTSTLTPGTHSLTAVFTPSDPATYSSSTSTAVSLDVKAPTGATTTTPQATVLTQSTASIELLSLFEIELAAKLTEAATGEPLVGRRVDFYGADQELCQASTDVYGWARCSEAENFGPQTAKEILTGYDAVFSGDGEYGPSTQHASATIGTGRPKP